jgi:hypothetical protein
MGDRAANLLKAIACFEAALRVVTDQGFPLEHKEIAENLSAARAALAGLQAGIPGYPTE